jgi:hypothetical protein
MASSAIDRKAQRVIRACYSIGEDLREIRTCLLQTLRQVVPFDAAFVAGSDPETLLFTSAFADDILEQSRSLFLDSEFDVDLARARDPVASQDYATGGERAASSRWREIMGPLGMGDELRAALRGG